MSRVVDFPDETYERLEEMARALGFDNIMRLIEQWLWDAELQRRKELGRKIDEHREEMFKKYGLMKDSTELVRKDRER